MRGITVPLLLALLLLVTGCYTARIETGQPASATVIEQSFASAWIYGLVPPSTVQTAERCPDGVAVVETQLSFVNQLVAMLTLGIYTPMSIRVVCAAPAGASLAPAGDGTIRIASGATRAEVSDAFSDAADRAVSLRQPVHVVFEGR